ncbi:MAG: putative transrane protein [Polaromonas sp.]|nr:putative transrane protein [Polaromonas sp.]
MNNIFDAFWRAALYCLHPRVIMLSLLPLVVMGAIALGLGYFFWQDAISVIRGYIGSVAIIGSAAEWLYGMGWDIGPILAPVLLLMLAVPVIVIASLLFVAVMMTPAMVKLVAERRFPQLERKRGGSFLASLLWSLGSTLVAGVALLLSLPLWLIPPLVLILPPLIWGWLTYRVMTYDALAEHASSDERKKLIKDNRGALLGIGILSGYLGAAPSLIWASGALFVTLAPVLVPLAIWVYTLVFAFSSLWFAHYTLAALERIRERNRDPAQHTPGVVAIDSIAYDLESDRRDNSRPRLAGHLRTNGEAPARPPGAV